MQLTTFGWLNPETWVQRVGGKDVTMAHEDKDICEIVYNFDKGVGGGSHQCPKCKIILNPFTYEGTEVYKCSFCQGTLVSEKNIKRIIIRPEVGFSQRIKKIAQGVKKEDPRTSKIIKRDSKLLYKCPKCRHDLAKMMRMFYTEAYHVAIDKCFTCGLVWFDQDELEVLQCLIEDATDKV